MDQLAAVPLAYKAGTRLGVMRLTMEVRILPSLVIFILPPKGVKYDAKEIATPKSGYV